MQEKWRDTDIPAHLFGFGMAHMEHISCTDPFGSYTGLVTDLEDKPVQDADDL